MQDQFTEVTSKGLFGRLGESIKSVAFGLLLFVIAFPVLFWNEGRTVKRMRTLESGAKQVISIKADAVVPGNQGKLVHLTGDAKTEENVYDGDFGVQVNAIKLIRNAEMYQWKERAESKTRKKIGGGEETTTEYKYEKVWSKDLIKSGDFKHPEGHDNRGSMPYESKTFTAKTVTIGAFTLSPGLIEKITKSEPLALDEDALGPLPPDMRPSVRISEGGFYIGKDPAAPLIGDMKIRFEIVKQPIAISLLSGQVESTFEPFKMKEGVIDVLKVGTFTADAMFQMEKEANSLIAWVLRLVGFLMMVFGITMIFKPLTVTADVLPFLGDMLEMGIGFFAAIISFALSLLTISIAWVFYRPLLGIPLLVIAIGSIVAFKMLGKKKKAA